MTNAAIAVGQPPWEKNSTSGTRHLDRGAEMREPARQPAGPQVVGEVLEELAFDATAAGTAGCCYIIVEITNGKCLLSFDVAAPSQITRHTSLARDDHVHAVAGEQERHRERRVHLAAGGQEDHLVAQAEHRQQHRGPSRSATSAARRPSVPSAGIGPGAVGEQRDEQHHQQRAVQQRRRPACAPCPSSAAPGSATVAAEWCWAATSTGSSPAAGRTGCSADRSRSPARRPRTASCRARPSRTRSARRTTCATLVKPSMPLVVSANSQPPGCRAGS